MQKHVVFPLLAALGYALGSVAAGADLNPQPEPPGRGLVRDIKTLSLADRLNLPPQTSVIVGGKSFTLGQLRENHAALEASRSLAKSVNAGKLRSIAGADYSFVHALGEHLAIAHGGSATPGPAKSTSPTPAPAATAVALGLVGPSGVPYPNDYVQFCKSVPATVCLYYPANVRWFSASPTSYITWDPLIDAPTCEAEGGEFVSLFQVCGYAYPKASLVNFVPPANGFTSSGWCDTSSTTFASTIDTAHGAVQIRDAGASGWTGPFSQSPSTEQFCFTQVKVPAK